MLLASPCGRQIGAGSTRPAKYPLTPFAYLPRTLCYPKTGDAERSQDMALIAIAAVSLASHSRRRAYPAVPAWRAADRAFRTPGEIPSWYSIRLWV